jgi:hypothetical protein
MSRMPLAAALAAFILPLLAADCRAGDAALFVERALSFDPPTETSARYAPLLSQSGDDIMRGVDGIPGWARAGEPRVFTREGLYGHIDGGAEIVLQYGFRELAVHVFEPAGSRPKAAGSVAAPATKEIVLEIYRMESGEAAFGLYSTKLEGGEERRPEVVSDNWITPGQANFVKGEYLINVLASDCTDREVGAFMAAIEKKVPGEGTVRPAGMGRLPVEGMVPGSGRYIKGALAAQNESPFLEAGFWGFGEGAAEAYAARYGAAPAVSKLILVEFFRASGAGAATTNAQAARPAAPAGLAENVIAVFNEYLRDVRRDGDTVEGQNQIGRWFLFRAEGQFAALVLGEPDKAAALSRLDEALRSPRSASPW